MSRGRVRGIVAAAVTAALWVVLTAGPAMAQDAPSPGGAQPFGASLWSDALLKVLIVAVPLAVTALLWVVLARGKPRS